MGNFINRNKPLAIFGSLVILLAAVSFNIYYFTVGSAVSSNELVRESDMVDLPGAEANSTVNPTIAQPETFNILPLVITVFITLIGVMILIIIIKMMDKNKHKQDLEYKQQLQLVAQAFEAYNTTNGNYPISAVYKPEHYTGIHLGKEWVDYSFPVKEEMLKFAAEWPILPAHKLDKVVYYPKNNGQEFSLYAYVPTLSKDEVRDYNKEDELPEAWGKFNYKISSLGVSQTPVSQPSATEASPKIDPVQGFNSTIPTQPPSSSSTVESLAPAYPVNSAPSIQTAATKLITSDGEALVPSNEMVVPQTDASPNQATNSEYPIEINVPKPDNSIEKNHSAQPIPMPSSLPPSVPKILGNEDPLSEEHDEAIGT